MHVIKTFPNDIILMSQLNAKAFQTEAIQSNIYIGSVNDLGTLQIIFSQNILFLFSRRYKQKFKKT